MNDDSDLLVMALGAGGAILLGLVLIPLRGLTPSANFTFFFVALIILVAEAGGRRAAVVTALVSALSLDFFLTQPYLTLAITDKHDLIAFLGLAACGLVAALFRGQRTTRTGLSRYLDLIDAALPDPEAGLDSSKAMARTLEAALKVLPLSALVLRDPRGKTLLATAGAGVRPAPELELGPAAGSAPSDGAEPFAADGARLALRASRRTLGYLDIWGSGRAASEADRRLLTMLARAMALRITVDAEPAPAIAGASPQSQR